MASVLDLVKHYQHSIEKYPNDEQKILKCINKLYNLGVTVQHLQETGVGRTVNALRKEPGDVGKAARALVYKWKLMVAAEESDQEGDHNNDTSNCNGHGNEKDSDDNNYQPRIKQEPYEGSSKHVKTEPKREDKDVNGHSRKRKYHSSEEEEPDDKKSRHSSSHSNDRHKKKHEVHVKKEQTDSESADSDGSQSEDSDSESSASSEEDVKVKIKTEPVENHKSSSSKHSQSNYKRESSSSKKSHDTETHSKHNSETKDKYASEKVSSKEKSHSSHKHKSLSEKEISSEKKYKSDHKSSESNHRSSESNQRSESNHRSSESNHRSSESNHKSSDKDKKHRDESKSSKHNSSSEKHRSSSHKHDSGSEKQKNHSDKHSSKIEKSSSSHSHKSEKDKHKSSSDKDSYDKHRSRDSSSKEKHSSSSKDKSKDKTNEKSSSSKEKSSHSSKSEKKSSSDEKQKSDSKSKTDKNEDRSSEKKSKHKSSSSSSHKSSKSSSSKSKEDIPKKKVNNSEDSDDGIDCGSGASFAEALGMISPAKPKKKSAPLKDSISPSNNFNNDLSPASLLAPTAKLAPLPAIEISSLPEISPNYKPRPPPKLLPHFTEEEALSHVISSKNQRTKVYSGNKVIGKIPSLYEMCVHVLQEHIDALEYTGGVPYEILKPVVDRATPQQLFVLEHYNPYLMEDTDHLWQKFCQKNFRNKQRQEMETWREMYIRCQEEQEHRLKSLTANIRIAQEAKKAPIKQTKMAYVDSVVKPPRNIARKQAQHGTAFAATASPAARVASLAAASNVLKTGARAAPAPTVSSSTFHKPKKAPLMQKALQFMRGRKR